MWWNVPEAHDQEVAEAAPRSLAVAGTMQRRRRTVLTLLPVSSVRPNPEQPRKHFAEEKLQELATSIRDRGLLQPIVVRRLEGGYEILAGERRFRAAQLAGVDRLPALIREGDDPLEIALIENVQREDLAPLEEAEALAILIERHGYSHREVADLLGKSRPYVSNTLSLNRLPEPVKADLHREGRGLSRELLMGVARQETPDAALALWTRLKLDVMSVRQFRAERSGEAVTEKPAAQGILQTARRLNRVLRRLLDEGRNVAPDDQASVARVLRRTQRLVQRHLAALEPQQR
jgi:ParB family transcriptional regulator, chromosome partitioning protein